MVTVAQLRGPKVLGMAAFDLLGTLAVAAAVSTRTKKPVLHSFAALMVIAIGVHYLFGINTQLNSYIGLNKRVR